MKRLTLLSLLFCSLSLGLSNATANSWEPSPKLKQLAPNVNVNFRFYDIEAESLYELFQKVRLVGPAGQAGNKAAGKASYHMNWQLLFEKKTNMCRIGNATVDIDIEIVVPRWLNVDDQSEKSQQNWQIYLGALLDHETGHKDIVIDAADELIADIQQAAAKGSCDTIQKAIDKRGFNLLTKARKVSDEYDRKRKLTFQ
ncbi:DUF922 domain-containing protein [Motilimonas pumila]|uniref:DUF922 domain-containing protein n=1 Tax=Motilimonas pumila TaxID=2303987 RepID=A0A418YEU2_9GAMM|nr:DUF922 domain-containing protein [Motilimonas pumila]RJG47704.1 DUF922 domain-containing protein [Motilimonas pumila]